MEKGGEEEGGRRRKGGIKTKVSNLKMGEIKSGVGGLLLIGGALLAATITVRVLKRRRVIAREASKGSGRIMNGGTPAINGVAFEEDVAKMSSQPPPPLMVSPPSHGAEAIETQHREKRAQENEEASAAGGSSLEDSSDESNAESRWPAEASESSTTSLEECCMKHQHEPKAAIAGGLKAVEEDGVAEEGRMTVMGTGEKKGAGLLSKRSKGLLGLAVALMVCLVMLMVAIHSLRGRGVDVLLWICRAVFHGATLQKI